jgi:hypothetical protein
MGDSPAGCTLDCEPLAKEEFESTGSPSGFQDLTCREPVSSVSIVTSVSERMNDGYQTQN